jgi:hypothetical protein
MVWPSRERFGDFDGVRASYTNAAKDVNGLLLPAGDAWRAAWRRDAHLALYGADNFHPSPLGSYLAALVIVHRLTGGLPSSPLRLGSLELTSRQAALLRDAALDTAR